MLPAVRTKQTVTILDLVVDSLNCVSMVAPVPGWAAGPLIGMAQTSSLKSLARNLAETSLEPPVATMLAAVDHCQ